MAVAPAPDAVVPGRPDGLQALAERCVQCGLCLPHCPTYQLERQEAESPRGRIALWRGLDAGQLALSDTTGTHLDHCLGCRACETACPAGVRFGELLVAGRTLQRQHRRPGLKQAAIEWLAARPRLLDGLLGAYRRIAPVVPRGLRPLPRPPATPRTMPARADRDPRDASPAGAPTIALFSGCAGRRYDAPARQALQRLLAATGVAVEDVAGQTCCGALHAHAGDAATAMRLGRANRDAFAGRARVCATATGCQQALARSLAGTTTAVEDPYVTLDRAAGNLRFRPASARVALHLPCTQQCLDGSTTALRRLLARVPGLELVVLEGGCCGAAGSQMLDDPQRAARFRAPLLAAVQAGAADTLLSANVGCRLHLGNACPVPVRHPLEFLAEHLQ